MNTLRSKFHASRYAPRRIWLQASLQEQCVVILIYKVQILRELHLGPAKYFIQGVHVLLPPPKVSSPSTSSTLCFGFHRSVSTVQSVHVQEQNHLLQQHLINIFNAFQAIQNNRKNYMSQNEHTNIQPLGTSRLIVLGAPLCARYTRAQGSIASDTCLGITL